MIRTVLPSLFIALAIVAGTERCAAQRNVQLDLDYGRAFFYYKVKDYGTGFRNEPPSHYNYIAGFGVRVNHSNNWFIQTGARFTMYQQYFSTRKSWGVYEEAYPVIQFPVLLGLRKPYKRFAGEIAVGPTIAVMPDQYYGEFEAVLYHNATTADSLARGKVFRNYGAVFPLATINAGIDYMLSNNHSLYIKGALGWGFRTITRYYINYNDGGGANDQTATQWGKGNFSGVSLGIRKALSGNRCRLPKGHCDQH